MFHPVAGVAVETVLVEIPNRRADILRDGETERGEIAHPLMPRSLAEIGGVQVEIAFMPDFELERFRQRQCIGDFGADPVADIVPVAAKPLFQPHAARKRTAPQCRDRKADFLARTPFGIVDAPVRYADHAVDPAGQFDPAADIDADLGEILAFDDAAFVVAEALVHLEAQIGRIAKVGPRRQLDP